MNSASSSTEPRRRGRPPKDQTQPDAPRARLLRTGVAILTEKGFSAVGVEEILDAAQVPKGSFYHYFDSKDAFGLELIDAYADYFAHKLDRWFDNTDRAPLDRLRDFIADARSGMARYGYRRGCLVGNLGQEMGVLPPPFRKRLAAVLRDWEARTSRCLRSAQEAGEIPRGVDCEALAQFFWIGWEGAVLRAKLERCPNALDVFAEGFLAMVRQKDKGR
ncbi:acrylate utilization transcriptional regulator AcuR [Bradyrhizobium liaoningense]|uniref:acrylate utilization transcriptional regulator AcuR n=1 Tax=Bradyrhizobium liaoningense TaxID=43992 RepID=UPI001BA8BE3D|nr:TetR/AcrR family transcriptional regulator [Bradyrhizobium liaoningense]MBR0859219.1 TetR/AcrR family transcriptional regulator [Bradyrhizobium liaoningense]